MNQFQDKGWNLTAEGLKKLSDGCPSNNFQALLQSALNTDLRDIGAGVYPTDAKSKWDIPKQGVVVQIVKITRNVAAPKVNQESKFAPRLLKIQFTDGQNQFSGIEVEHISQLSLSDTKPGTKLYFRPGKALQISQDLVLLRPNQFDLLGGHVKDLVEKWEVARKYSKYANVRAITQAPPWIAFGQKIDRKAIDLSKKSLVGSEKREDGDKGDDPFDSQRKEAIAEATKTDSKRVFLDGAKIVHHNVQKIVDKGFSEEDAKNALKLCRNDLGRALASLKRPTDTGDEDYGRFSGRGRGRGGGRRGRGGRNGGMGRYDEEEEENMAKPSEKISLFDFIGDKLPANLVKPASVPTNSEPHRSNNHGYAQQQQTGAPTYRSQRPMETTRGAPPQRHSGRQGDYQNAQPAYNQRGSGQPRTPNERHRPTAIEHPPESRPSQGPDRRRNNYSGYPDNTGQQHNHHGRMQRVNQDMNKMQIASHQGPSHKYQQQHVQSNGFPNYDPHRIPEFLNKDTKSVPQHATLSQPGPQFHQNHRPPKGGSHQNYTPSNNDPNAWKWKVGDRCLAKYWEDGKYYNAEVTGVTPSTCVVHFMEYGNYEEVVKADCLPITA